MIVPAVVFIAAVLAAVIWGGTALRFLVAITVLLAGLRGGLLVLASDAGLSDPTLTVNALVPAIVAAIVVGVILRLQPTLSSFSRPLLIGWSLIAFAALVNFAVQTVGLKLYGIGLAQYLVYPTLALIIWPIMEAGDERRLARILMATGLVVATSVMLQAAEIESFIQAANSQVDGLAADRYAGITGSYLHTSAFLGTCFVLVLAESIRLNEWKERLIAVALLAWIFGGVILTFSRSGAMISAIGIASLFIFAARGRRVAYLAVVIPAIVIAVGAGALGGVNPGDAGERAASGLKTEGDTGNDLRSEAISEGIDSYGDLALVNQALGDGLAATGNARQLEDTGNEIESESSEKTYIVESYYLKILTETGMLGLVLIGGFLVWSLAFFCWVLFQFPDPRTAGLAAAGLGLGLYNIIYPALETQLLALTWWVVFSLSLRAVLLDPGLRKKFVFPLGDRQKPTTGTD
ncbi:MAG: O-antigen ligase family protein [Solirubrobacterales bacterium]